MKLKQQPDDFLVEELTDVTAGREGAFALYRLEKVGWATPDALAAVRRRWKIDLRRLSYGGLKDRHARTVQYLSIFRGPARDLRHHGIEVRYLGQVPEAYTSHAIRANRFALTLRDLADEEGPAIDVRLAAVRAQGVPNYFDDQRFGSVSGGGEFIARHLVHGRFEDALKLALAAPYAFDRARQKREKETLLRHWGDWEACKAALPRGHARSLVDYLRVHPGDFKGAVVRLRPELRGLYLSAYQSHLWNRTLARWLERHLPPESLRPVTLRTGPLPFHDNAGPETLRRLEALALPLPSARWRPAEGDERRPLVEEVLAEEGLTLAGMQVRGVRDLFFSKGERPALCRPGGLTHSRGPDELHPGRAKLRLAFELPRGSYATLVVKAATAKER
jgi:tRNA pseudouridine13 synthase